ncbi:hypothetical protein [Citricoccus sp. I39-566]|nr:hypothetical protein [Citricoccus sp. I39-566]WMY79131.1 hypothetical protein RE421_04495 [Citricoccus sp. I39-566]
MLAVPGTAEALTRVAAVTVDGDARRVDATSGP